MGWVFSQGWLHPLGIDSACSFTIWVGVLLGHEGEGQEEEGLVLTQTPKRGSLCLQTGPSLSVGGASGSL